MNVISLLSFKFQFLIFKEVMSVDFNSLEGKMAIIIGLPFLFLRVALMENRIHRFTVQDFLHQN